MNTPPAGKLVGGFCVLGVWRRRGGFHYTFVMELSSGMIVGPYRVEREIGRGGMGVVYLAVDTRLDRDVAIKALPAELASDAARLERFEREAKTLAQLSHPNLAGIYGVEEQEGARFLVLEYVPGETLADRLDRGALPLDDALEFAGQICAGVKAAHEAGVVHRDLKPANIKITSEGKAKVLDFGLARSDGEAVSSSGLDISNSPTISSPVQHSPTIPGAIMGTAPYMSPEQARGRRVDKRTDIWSFGVVLYEMLTGIGPFHGETATDSIGAILHKDVDLGLLPKGTPVGVRRVLKRCLERDKAKRYRDIGDVGIDLTHVREDGQGGAHAGGSERRVALWPMALAAVVLGVVGVIAGMQLGGGSHGGVAVRVSIEPPEGVEIRFSGDLSGPPVVSPDGRMVVFAAAREGEERRLWVRELGDITARELEDTEGALFPFWSPDSREVGYFTMDSLRRVDIASETVQRVCVAEQGRGGTWTEDGRIVFARRFRGGLWIVDEDGGTPTALTEIDEELHTSHRWPLVVPGTDRFVFLAVSARADERENNAIYVGDLDGGTPERLMRCDYRAEYHDGWLLFVRDDVLMAQRAELDSAELIGNPVVVAKDLAPDLSTWHGQFSASGAGALVYNRASSRDAGRERERVTGYSWTVEGDRISTFDEFGRVVTAYAVDTPMAEFSMSPDGQMLAVSVVSEDGYLDLWLSPTVWRPTQAEVAVAVQQSLLSSAERRLTFFEGIEISPQWSPDSKEIIFRWDGDGAERPRGMYIIGVDGGEARLFRDNKGRDDYPVDWTDDGKYIIATYGTHLVSGDNDLWAIPVDGGEEIPLVTDPGADYAGQVSPDGKWLAYVANEPARNVYVIPFKPGWDGDAPSGKWLVSENGGTLPRWSKEGDQLFYISDASVLIQVEVETGGRTFLFSSPRAMFQSPWDIGRTYDLTPTSEDTSRTYTFLDSGERGDARIGVILNWQALLEEGE